MVYTQYGEPLELSGSGSDLITVHYHGISVGNSVRAVFKLENKMPGRTFFMRGAHATENGVFTYEPENDNNELEFLLNDKWVNLGSFYYQVEQDRSDRVSTFDILTEDNEERWYYFDVPAENPGRYRATLTFREYFPRDDRLYDGSTGEIYAVSFEFEVEAAQGDGRVNILDTAPLELRRDMLIDIGLISNYDISDLWLDTESVTLVSKDGTTVPIESSHYQPVTHKSIGNRFSAVEDESIHIGGMWVYISPKDTLLEDQEYMLRAYLYENPDGTGERYTLQLRLKFSEE